jgi:hypothetical protein
MSSCRHKCYPDPVHGPEKPSEPARQGVTPAACAGIHRRAASAAVVNAGTPSSQGGRMARPLSVEHRWPRRGDRERCRGGQLVWSSCCCADRPRSRQHCGFGEAGWTCWLEDLRLELRVETIAPRGRGRARAARRGTRRRPRPGSAAIRRSAESRSRGAAVRPQAAEVRAQGQRERTGTTGAASP